MFSIISMAWPCNKHVVATHSFSLLGSHINRCFTTDSPELSNMNTATDIYMMPTCIHKHTCLWRMFLRVDFLDHRAYALLTVLDNPNLFSKSVLISTPTSMSRTWVSPLFPFSPVCGIPSSVSGTSVWLFFQSLRISTFPHIYWPFGIPLW